MAEEGSIAMSLTAPPSRRNVSPFSSSSFRVRFADRPSSASTTVNHYEFDEDEVVWSPDLYSDISSPEGGDSPDSIHSGISDSDSSPNFPSDLRRRPFLTERFGLSAALSDDREPPVNQRRQAINIPVSRTAADGELNKISHQSAPMNIPAWPRGRRQPASALMDVNDDDEDDDAAEMLPPHVIVARSHMKTFSVFEGVGRTLKGRDLRRVRNAVFQKTGFLD